MSYIKNAPKLLLKNKFHKTMKYKFFWKLYNAMDHEYNIAWTRKLELAYQLTKGTNKEMVFIILSQNLSNIMFCTLYNEYFKDCWPLSKTRQGRKKTIVLENLVFGQNIQILLNN